MKVWFRQGWFIEGLKNSFQKEWIDVFEKIKETATIPQIIKICHLLKEIKNPGKFCESSMKLSYSMTWEMSGMFIDQDCNLSDQIRKLHVTPSHGLLNRWTDIFFLPRTSWGLAFNPNNAAQTHSIFVKL